MYEWGYEKVIFDDIGRMVSACKRYKEDPALEPSLGDFSEHVSELDPFRDGRASERAGNYIRWLLESFDNGTDGQSSVKYANQVYIEEWGVDKVVPTGLG
jgi:hypothetical protein